MQKQISKMIDERVRTAHKCVEHETHGLKGAVKVSVGPQKGIGSESHLNLGEITDDEIVLFENIRVIKPYELETGRRGVNGHHRQSDEHRGKAEPAGRRRGSAWQGGGFGSQGRYGSAGLFFHRTALSALL